MKRSTIYILLGVSAVLVAGAIIYFMQRAKKKQEQAAASADAQIEDANAILPAVYQTRTNTILPATDIFATGGPKTPIYDNSTPSTGSGGISFNPPNVF